MKTLGIIFLTLIAIVFLFLAPWLFLGNDYFLTKYFAPKREQVRRETFEQSKAYLRGTINDLQDLRIDYNKSTDENQKRMIASIILQRSSDFPADNLPSDLRVFITSLKNQ